MPDTPIALRFRRATLDDVPTLMALLADDVLGSARECLDDTARAAYEQAFAAIEAQTGNQIVLAFDGARCVGMLQLTFIPGLSHRGSLRAQIESVRVRAGARGQGIGRQLFVHAIDLSVQAGCAIVQLTTDRRRDDAVRFYESLGFVPTHVGMKLSIAAASG